MSDLFESYKIPLEKALKDLEHPRVEISNNHGRDSNNVEFIIYSPNSSNERPDFSIYKNNKAVLSLFAGVENLVYNKSLKCPLIKMVDDGLTKGMVQWCVGHTLRLHLGIDRHILGQDGIWRNSVQPPLTEDRRVGILGLGELGKATGVALNHLGFQVMGWSKSRKYLNGIVSQVGNDGLRKTLKFSQILIILLPSTEDTFKIINTETLSYLPKNASIINAGRGSLIDEDALLRFLNNGHLSNATLDVFMEEPLPKNHPFWWNPRVTVTPHVAADTRVETSANVLAENIVKICRGELPIGLVNPKAGY